MSAGQADETRKPPWGTPERIALCRRHSPSPGINLVTGEPNGKVGCWHCGADLTDLRPLTRADAEEVAGK